MSFSVLVLWAFCMNIHPLHSFFLIPGQSAVTLPYVLRYTPYSIHSLHLIIVFCTDVGWCQAPVLGVALGGARYTTNCCKGFSLWETDLTLFITRSDCTCTYPCNILNVYCSSWWAYQYRSQDCFALPCGAFSCPSRVT